MFTLKVLHCPLLLVLICCNPNTYSLPRQTSINNPLVIPQQVKVGPFFKGSQAVVTAELPECAGVIVKFFGKDKEIILNEKGKKAFIWLNVAQVTIRNAPSIYILTSTDRLDNICSDTIQNKETLGYNALNDRIVFESTSSLRGNEFEEFIKFNENSGCYSIDNNAEIILNSDGRKTLKATIEIPSFISPDEYLIELYCFNAGNLIDKAVLTLSVEEVGLPLFIKNLAMNSPAIYGISAIIVAMIAGSIIGLIFTKKKSRK